MADRTELNPTELEGVSGGDFLNASFTGFCKEETSTADSDWSTGEYTTQAAALEALLNHISQTYGQSATKHKILYWIKMLKSGSISTVYGPLTTELGGTTAV